jgi:hypothetical protein
MVMYPRHRWGCHSGTDVAAAGERPRESRSKPAAASTGRVRPRRDRCGGHATHGRAILGGDEPLRAVRAARRRVAGADGPQDSLPLARQARPQQAGRRSGQRADRHAGALGCRRGRRRRAGRRGRPATHRTLPAPSAKGVDREITGPSGSRPVGGSASLSFKWVRTYLKER